ncbi:MAG TPA: amidohydrolase family protein [Woeseiaceae bacterium]|nr:amidohydrolase family protein [Woeseiaceae bacterium]
MIMQASKAGPARGHRRPIACLSLMAIATLVGHSAAAQVPAEAKLHDSHFHLTNYVQRGPALKDYVAKMGSTIGRSTVFGIPLQQQWDFGNTGDWAPTYYLQTDAPLYYYSFTDAHLAMQFLALTPDEQSRLDPMIIGFNPADMYAVDHIRRVLTTFPGVFTGIGEFTIHKEFVSAKIAGGPPSLTDPALDRIFEFAGETGLVVLIHNDVDMPFPKPDQDPYSARQLGAVLRRHPEATVVWAHVGLGRVVHPVQDMAAIIGRALADPALSHVYIDISWDETAKYLVASPEAVVVTADLINRYPDRFLFGSDVVATPPASIEPVVAVYDIYAPLWAALSVDTRNKILKGNYERIFDEARAKVRAWEEHNIH